MKFCINCRSKAILEWRPFGRRKNNVWYGTSSVGKNCRYFSGYSQLNLYQSTKLIFVGDGQLNSTTILDFCTRQVWLLLFKYAAFGRRAYFLVLTRVFARFQQSCALEASVQIFWISIGSLSQTLYRAQLTEKITKYKHPPFFLLISL